MPRSGLPEPAYPLPLQRRHLWVRPVSLRTARLELLLGTPALFKLDIEDRTALGHCLDADVPTTWPPEFMDEKTLGEFITLSSDPNSGFSSFYWVLRGGGERTLIGSGGILRESPERVMIGYAILEEWQGRGLGTEAIDTLVEFAFRDPGVEQVVAYTYPDRLASIRVLEKNGFTPYETDGGDPGTIAFERRRSRNMDEPVEVKTGSNRRGWNAARTSPSLDGQQRRRGRDQDELGAPSRSTTYVKKL